MRHGEAADEQRDRSRARLLVNCGLDHRRRPTARRSAVEAEALALLLLELRAARPRCRCRRPGDRRRLLLIGAGTLGCLGSARLRRSIGSLSLRAFTRRRFDASSRFRTPSTTIPSLVFFVRAARCPSGGSGFGAGVRHRRPATRSRELLDLRARAPGRCCARSASCFAFELEQLEALLVDRVQRARLLAACSTSSRRSSCSFSACA